MKSEREKGGESGFDFATGHSILEVDKVLT